MSEDKQLFYINWGCLFVVLFVLGFWGFLIWLFFMSDLSVI